MEDKIKTLLEAYGLDEKEIKIYIILVEKRELNAYILAKIAGIHRSTTYAVLDRLISKGFVSRVEKDGKIFYSAVEISQTIAKIKDKEAILLSLVPEFENLHEQGVSRVKVLESKEGQKQFYLNLFNQIKYGKIKEIYFLSGGPSGFLDTEKYSDDLSSSIFLENILKELRRKKLHKKIRFKGIWNEKFKNSKLLKFFSGLSENRFLNELPTLATTVIFGDSIAYLFTMNKIPQAIEIQNKLIAQENKAYFSYLWKMAKE